MLTFLSRVCVVYLMCESVDFLKIYDSLCGPSPCKMPSPWIHSRPSQSELSWFVARSWDSVSLSLSLLSLPWSHLSLLALTNVLNPFSVWIPKPWWECFYNDIFVLCIITPTLTSILLDHVIMNSYILENLHCFVQLYVSIKWSNSHINKYKRHLTVKNNILMI